MDKSFTEYFANITDYQPANAKIENYDALLNSGLEVCSQSKVVIAGLVRNTAGNFAHIQRVIYALSSLFRSFEVILYENDSLDSTPAMLSKWAYDDKRVHYISERLGTPRFGSVLTLERLELMAQYRNKYLDYIDNNIPDVDYVIVIDTDIRDVMLSGVGSSFGIKDWDCITSNGLDTFNGVMIYYDIATLVIHGSIRNGKILLPMPLGYFIKVESAFGGVGIYRYEAIKGKRYASGMMRGDTCVHHADERPMIEHIGLNLQLDNIYINTYQMVLR